MGNEMETMYGTRKSNRSWRRVGGSDVLINEKGEVKGRKVYVGRYCSFGLFNKTLYVHRVVYEIFKGPIPEGNDINHIDGNKHNNHISNLETATRSENQKHAFKNGLNRPTIMLGKSNPNYRKGAWLNVDCYHRAWDIAKRKGLDWKSMTPKQRIKLPKDNPKKTKLVEYQGVTKSLKEWCKELGLEYERTWCRLSRYGHPVEIAFTPGKLKTHKAKG